MARKTKKIHERDTLDIAQELLALRRQKNDAAAVERVLADELKRRLKEGDASQNLFEIDIARTLKITDRDKAVAWAQAKYPHIITVDAKAARTILQREFSLPDGFTVSESERLVQVGEKDDTE